MIEELKPYADYKESGLPWLGQVPGHWEVKHLGAVGRFSASGIDKKTVRGEPLVRMINYLDIYRNSSHTIEATRKLMTVSCPVDKLQMHSVRSGDLFFTPSSETSEDIGHSAVAIHDIENAVYSYHVIRFRPARHIDTQFSRFWCNNPSVLSQFSIASRGTTRKILDRGDFRRILVVLPPPDEQILVGRFLDWADGRLERAIRAKRKVIALLNEQKQAIIHRAVTRGLDPTVPLKPSGIPWLGDIPRHWEVRRFKTSVGFQEGPGIMLSDFREAGVPLLRISCLAGTEATLAGCNYLSPAKVREKWSHFAVEPGDYLLSASGSTGAVRRASAEVVGAIPYTGIIRLWRKSRGIDMEYLRLFMSAKPFAEQISMAKSGVGIEHFGPSHLKRMWILQPPVEEQTEIVGEVRDATAGLEAGVSRLEREIELLREYRTRLVADVVTGKLDVREAAARLPDEAPLDSVADNTDLDDDPDIADAEAEE